MSLGRGYYKINPVEATSDSQSEENTKPWSGPLEALSFGTKNGVKNRWIATFFSPIIFRWEKPSKS